MRRTLLILLSILLSLVFVVVPLVSLLASGALGTSPGEALQTAGPAASSTHETFSRFSGSFHAWLNSITVALAATSLDAAAGLLLAFAVTKVAVPGRRGWLVLSVVPFVVPTFMAALGLMVLFGKSGVITTFALQIGARQPFDIYSLAGITVVHVFTFLPFSFLTCASMLTMLGNSSLVDQARALGATNLVSLFTVTAPLLRPAIARGALLTFVASFSDFGAPMVLLPADRDMVIVRLYRGLLGIHTDWNEVSLMSAMMLATIAVVASVAGAFFLGDRVYKVQTEAVHSRVITDRLMVAGMFLICLAVLALPIMVLTAILVMSLASSWGDTTVPTSLSLRHYVTALSSSWLPLLNTVVLSILTLAVAVPWGIVVAYYTERTKRIGRWVLYPLAIVPFAVPGIILGIAYIRSFNTPPLALHGTVAIVVIAYIVKKSAYCIQATRPAFHQFGSELEEASSLLGAPRSFTICKVTAPYLCPSVVAGALLIYISTIHDLSVTIMLTSPEWTPLSLYIFREIEAGRIFTASAYSVLLIVLVLLAAGAGFAIIKRSYRGRLPLRW